MACSLQTLAFWREVVAYSNHTTEFAETSPSHARWVGQMAGKPVIRGTRLSVECVIGLMADGWKEADIMTNYPGITHDDVMACLAYARDTLSSEKVFPSAA
jgi:uncharacterized protein (DUF433 family)